MVNKKHENVVSTLFNWARNSKRFLLLALLCGILFAIPVLALDAPIPSNITDGSLFELEGDTPHPLILSTTLQFLPLEAQVATTNGNGWRHEYKIDQPHRLPMGATHEFYTATYKVDMSDGAKSIIVQYHGDSPTLMKMYYADSTEQFVDGDNNPVGDSIGKNGIFDLYVRLRTKDLPNYGEDVFHFGTLVAGDTFDVIVENNYGTVSVTAMGQTVTRELEQTPTDYLKFGNYLQAQVTTDTDHAYGGQKCKDLEPPLGFADCYAFLGITKSIVTLTDVTYQRTVDDTYVLPAPEANLELLNGGFEDSLNEWIQEEPVTPSGDTHTGSGSAKITAAPGRFYQRVEVMADTEYELSAYVRGEGAVGVKGTERIDDVARTVDLVETFDVTDWTLVSITFTTGTDPLPVYVYGLHGSSGDVRFDDFSLESESAPITGNNFCSSTNTNAAPATVFNLANWRIKIPDASGSTIQPDDLATLNNEFFCLTDDGAMVFYAPVDGGTDGSTYPRSELREMVDPSSSSVGWVISGTHKMSASTTVTLEPSNGKIVIAQVDSQSDDILAKIQWQGGKIKAQLRQIEADGSTGSYADYKFAGNAAAFPIGTTFDWDMTIENGVLSVTVDGETTTLDFASIPMSTSPSDYADDEFYFSVGSQPQDNTLDSAGEAGEILFHSFDVTHVSLASSSIFCPSANAAPATVFDLANWRIKLPDGAGSTVQPDDLATLNNEFFCLSDDGAMVMYAPVEGGTAGSTYPRTELREMVDPSSESVGWVISGTHTMSATTKVTVEPSNGKIVIAQVDSLSENILAKIQWDNDKIRAQLRQIDSDGSSGSYTNYYFAGGAASFPVGTSFDWSMTVENGVVYVTVNGETEAHDFALTTSPSDYADDELYFSVGSQPQDSTQDDPGSGVEEAGEVLFYSLDVTHGDSAEPTSCPGTNGAPATTFDLANWRIKLPDAAGSTIQPDDLATLDNEFFCLSDDGAMVMHAPVDGGTGGSTYPRTELREMVDPSSSSVGWVISGTHKMSASTTVTQEPSNGKIVIAQVDGMGESILGKLQWQSGKIKAQLRQINTDGSTGSYADFWFAGGAASFPVGTRFDWDMTVEDGMLFVTINGETKTHDFALATSVYAADQLYFSVGSQPQDNTLDAAGEAAEVLFYSLDLTHEAPSEPTTCPSTNGAPATTFDLANWRIKIPDADGSTIQPDDLATLDNEFFCLSDDGAMVMYVPVDGGTDGSTYPRTELREMVDPSSSGVGWIISGTHTMSATTTVTQQPSNGKIVIAQVDGMGESILGKLQWQSGKIKAQLRQINTDGSTGSYADFWFAGGAASFPVDTMFDWDMIVEDGMLSVTINGETKTHDFALATSVYAADQLYFSVGSQPQDNTLDAAGEAAEVQFHSLTVTHIDPIAAVVTINDATVSEGEDAVLVIGLDNVRDTDTTMQVQTVDGTATGAATDYESVNITATIAAGTFSTTVTIQTIDDADVEGQETLTVALSSLTGTNVTFADDQAQVIITEDDSNETSTTVTIDPAVGTTLTFSNAVGSEATPVTTIQVPAGSVSETMTLMYNAIDEETDDVEFEFAGTRFDMTAYVNGEVYEHYTFAGPVTVTLHYSDTQIASMREDTLRLQFWTGSDWIDAAATCYGDDPTQVPDDAYVRDEGNQTISVEICHLTEFAMFAEPFYRYYLPVWFHND